MAIQNITADHELVKKASAYRWVIFGVLSVIFLIVNVHRFGAGVVREDMIRDFGVSATTFANLGSTYFYVYVLMQIPSGMLADSLGPRKTVGFGFVLAGFGSVLFGLAPNLLLAFAGRILVALGVSSVFICILKICSRWYNEKDFATMSGLTSFIGNTGGVLAQTPLALLVVMLTWRTSFVVIGVVSLALAVLAYLVIRNDPADMNWPGFTEQSATGPADSGETAPGIRQGFARVITDKRMYICFIAYLAFFGALTATTATWGTSYFVEVYGLSRVAASNYIAAAMFGLACGCFAVGKISDSLRKRKLPMFVFGGVAVACWSVIVFVNGGKPPLSVMMPLMFVLGFSSSAYVPVWALGKEYNHPGISGVAMAMVNSGGHLGAGILPIFMGMVIDRYANILPSVEIYHKAFMICLVSAVIGFFTIFLIKETNCRNIYTADKE